MSERNQLRDVCFRFLLVFIFAGLYSLGGMEDGGGKWIRRFLAPTILCGGMFYFSRDWRCFVQMPFMMGALTLGYGGTDNEILKILKRGLFGFANGLASSVRTIWNKNFILSGLQLAVVMAGSIVLGVYNPIGDARTEEFAIGVLISLIPALSSGRSS